MLRFRLPYLLASKGIANHYNFLIKNGFTPNVATRCVNGKVEQLKLTHINKLCKVLHCTPNDLLEWYPGKDEILPEQHPLKALVREDKPFNIIGHLSHLTFDQIKEIEQVIAKMNESGQSV